MTPEELKDIEDRINKTSWEFTVNGLFNKADCDFVMYGKRDLQKLLEYIKELESQIPRWIPVEERLPEKEGIYLVFEPWVYGVNALWFVLGMDGLPNSTTKKAWETVSHWKSLPKGPEE